jgi:AcrR family transcriptional regulator
MNTEEKLIKAAMQLLARDGWAAVTLPAIAKQAKMSLKLVEKELTQPSDVLIALIEWVDAQTLSEEAEGSVREALFEFAMRRFEALTEYRDALSRLHSDKAVWPRLACAVLPALLTSSRAMLEAAGVNTEGPLGQLRALVWLSLKAAVARTWFHDESEDLSVTMAALDKRLSQLEKAAEVLSPLAA